MTQKQKKMDASKPSTQLKNDNAASSERSGQTSDAELTFEDFDKLNLKSFGDDVLRVIEGDKILSEDQKAYDIFSLTAIWP